MGVSQDIGPTLVLKLAKKRPVVIITTPVNVIILRLLYLTIKGLTKIPPAQVIPYPAVPTKLTNASCPLASSIVVEDDV